MKNTNLILVLIFFGYNIYAQSDFDKFSGIYGNWLPNGETLGTKLNLKEDGTFELTTDEYSYKDKKYKEYSNIGKWVANGKEIILNPELKRRKAKLEITEKQIELKDSIEIRVNQYIEVYENQKKTNKERVDFSMITIYFNKRRKKINLRHRKYIRNCGLAPRIGKQKIIDTTNTFRIAKKELNKIGILTYGIKGVIETEIQNKNANYFEIDLIIPIDKEKMPRSKKIIIKGKRAYYYENWKGKIDVWKEPLHKKTA